MRSALPIFILLPAAVLAVGLAGGTGAGVAAVVGLILAALAVVLVSGEEVGARSGRSARRMADTRFLTLLVLAAFVARAALAILLRQFDLNILVGGDEETFDANGRVFQSWLEGRLSAPFTDKWEHTSQVGYFVVVGCIYWVFGVVQMVPVLLNCIVGALTAVPVYRMTARMAGGFAARTAAILVVFFPSFVLWSSLLVRDALAIFLIATCASLGQSLLRRVSISAVIGLIAALGALATLRSYMFLLLVAALFAGFVVSAARRPGRALGVSVLATLGVLLLVQGAGLGAEFVGEDYLARIHEQRLLNGLAGNSAIELGAHDISTPGGALQYLPIGLAYFVLAPFPWQMGGRQVLALPDIIIWYACLPLVILGAIWAFRRRRTTAVVPLIAGISICVLYGLVEGNVGIIVRHRAQALVVLLPFAAAQVARLVRARRRRRAHEAAQRARLRTRAQRGRIAHAHGAL